MVKNCLWNGLRNLDEVSRVYELVIDAGLHKANSINVSEAVKGVENSQRNIKIAFMSELAKVFDKMGVESQDVVDAMNTKWNDLASLQGW